MPSAALALLLVVSALASLPTRSARAEVRYTVVALGTFGGPTSKAHALNNADPVQVVGTADLPNPQGLPNTRNHAFLWEDGSKRDLGTLGDCDDTIAFDVNESGRVAGHGEGTQTQSLLDCWRGFVWQPPAPGSGGAGTMNPLQGPTPSNDWPEHCFITNARAINDAGKIAGNGQILYEHQPSGNETCSGAAYRWPSGDGAPEMFGITNVSRHNSASDINAGGFLAGSSFQENGDRATIWSPGPDAVATILDTRTGSMPSERYYSYAYGLADDGDAVGSATTSFTQGDTRAFLWSEPGSGTNLGTLDAPYDCYSKANAINSADQVVGLSWFDQDGFCDSTRAHAFLWENGEMLDLNDLIAADSGWVLTEATDINDRGEIVGFGTHNGNKPRAFLLTFGGQSPVLFDTFALDAPPVTEGGGGGASALAAGGPMPKPTAKFVVKRDEGGGTSKVKYATQNDTAKAGQDYVAKSGTLTFTGNQKSKTVKVTILNNNRKEPNEKFFLTLSKPSDNAKITDRKAKATIRDDD